MLPVPPPFTIGTGATSRTARTTAARRSAISAAERRLIMRIAGFWALFPSGSSPRPAMCAS
jgi:hypothetical protein